MSSTSRAVDRTCASPSNGHPAAQICPYCGERFTPLFPGTARETTTCQRSDCRMAKRNTHSKAYRRLAKRGVPIARCEICGHPYEKTKSDRRTCGSVNCQTERNRRYGARYYLARRDASRSEEPPKERRYQVCGICGRAFLPRNRRQWTCGRKECVRERERRAGLAGQDRLQAGTQDAVNRVPESERTAIASRNCLRCERLFKPEHKGYWLCRACRRKNERDS